MAEEICDIGAWEEDLWQCFALHEGAAEAVNGACGAAVCSLPTNSSDGGAAGRCETCATVVVQEWNQLLYIYGELQWAAFGPSEVEEAELQGYQVSLTDHCGRDLLLLQSLPVDPLKATGDDDSCCDAAKWYVLRIGYTAIPKDTVALAISSWEGNFQKLLPLFQDTYTTTTTTSLTITLTTSMTTSITKVSTTSSTYLSSTTSNTQEPLLEMLEGCLSVSTLSADVFTSNPLEARLAVQQALADATQVDVAMVEVTSLSLGGCATGGAGGAQRRRLQEELSFDYVIRFPPSSPSAAGGSVAQAAAQQLAEMPVNEVTTLVRQRLAEQPIFKDVEVEVLSVDVKVIEVVSTSSTTLRAQQDPIEGGAGEIVAMVAAPIGLLLCCIAAWLAWRWQRRRTQVTKAYLPSLEEEEPKKGRERPKVDFASPGSDGSDGSQPPDTVLDIAAVHGRAKELDFHQHARGLRDAEQESFDHEFLDWTDQFCAWATATSTTMSPLPTTAALKNHGQILRGIGVSSDKPPPLPPLPSKLPSKSPQALEIEEYHSPTAQVCEHCGKPESQCRQRVIEGYLYNPFYEGPHSRPQERRRPLPKALLQAAASSSSLSRTPRRRYEPL